MQETQEEKLNSTEELDFSKLDFEAQQNLIGLFSLLLKIDKRNNKDLYKLNK